ncbi:hypothetical protein [Streptomyces natalensis]|uniref:Membrane protein n=1 Tax=Streptomyces natalensis ATCC 27448 TaxID=1240678 RepID=A0A0D7CGL6_9ACTN|nr:hypothetical protein [Streptomyces natalensis]KIZ15404.1 membrane protein [Streptomyces natalensis ATCC 27448]
MKSQQHAQAGARGGSPASPPVGERLPVTPRERKPALAALAVLLILAGALGSTVLVLRAGERVEAIKVTQRVSAGEKIPESAISSVMVAKDSDVQYVEWSQRGLLSKYRASTDLVEGSVLVGPMLTEQQGPKANQVVVGLSLKSGQYPTGLKAGDMVAAYQVGTDDSKSSAGTGRAGTGGTGGTGGATGSDPLLVERAKVQTVKGAGGDSTGGGDLPVSLVVDQAAAPKLTQAAAAGDVSLVLVPTHSS